MSYLNSLFETLPCYQATAKHSHPSTFAFPSGNRATNVRSRGPYMLFFSAGRGSRANGWHAVAKCVSASRRLHFQAERSEAWKRCATLCSAQRFSSHTNVVKLCNMECDTKYKRWEQGLTHRICSPKWRMTRGRLKMKHIMAVLGLLLHNELFNAIYYFLNHKLVNTWIPVISSAYTLTQQQSWPFSKAEI